MDDFNYLELLCDCGEEEADALYAVKANKTVSLMITNYCEGGVETVILNKTKARKLKGFLEEFLDE